ncbi:MAG: glycerol acyltransferase, partial [Ramlibacter sp.]|nr:glycerol acyltransferase [Ramlibacter sp.]
FSRVENGQAMVRPLRRGMFNRVGLQVGTAIPAAAVSPEHLRECVQRLLGTAS